MGQVQIIMQQKKEKKTSNRISLKNKTSCQRSKKIITYLTLKAPSRALKFRNMKWCPSGDTAHRAKGKKATWPRICWRDWPRGVMMKKEEATRGDGMVWQSLRTEAGA